MHEYLRTLAAAPIVPPPPPGQHQAPPAHKVGTTGACEYRAHGFSQTGLSFVLATSCAVALFGR